MSKAVTDDNFEDDVLKASGPVVVDFWAEWCGPCRQIAPALEEIAAEKGGAISIVKLNIDDSPVTTGKYGVRGIPTLILFKDGKVVSKKMGAMPKSKILEWIDEAAATA
jgi:thioredoxin 1